MKGKIITLLVILSLLVLLVVLVSVKVFPRWLTIPGGVFLLLLAVLNWILDLGSKLQDWIKLLQVDPNKEQSHPSVKAENSVVATGEQGRAVVAGQYIEKQIIEAAKPHATTLDDAKPAINLPQLIQDYKQRFVKNLKGDWFEKFIDLHIEIPVKLRSQSSDQDTPGPFTISQLAAEFSNTPIAILGEPGAGKTTLVKKLSIDFANKDSHIPIFIRMGEYLKQGDFHDLLNFTVYGEIPADRLVEMQFLVVFDGLNETDLEYRDDAARDIVRFIKSSPQNQYFITCRPAEFPPYLRRVFSEFYVLRISQETIQEYLTKVLGNEKGRMVYSEISKRIKNLCENPLMLTMLTYLFAGDSSIIHIPTSKASLYEQFLSKLYNREDELRFIENTHAIREEFLGYIAYRLDNKLTVFKRKDAEKWIQERFKYKYRGIGINLMSLFHEVLNLPPLTALTTGRQTDVELRYMHQSFQEYYAAFDIRRRFSEGDITLNDVVGFSSLKNERWWESLSLFVGLQDDATAIVKAMKKYAVSVAEKEEDQRVLTLVARCIRESKYVEPAEVDDVIIRTLFTFKFGKVAFDYNLIYGLKLIEPEQRSISFPKRLIDDINWWLDKYARVLPVKLDQGLSIDQLVQYIKSDDEILAYDALFTLRYHPVRTEALFELVSLLENSAGNLLEQAIMTIGYLEKDAEMALDILIKIIGDPNETKWARAYALNALGRIGNKKAVQPMVDYMLNHKNPYRDSASWSLQNLAKKHPEDEQLYSDLRRVFTSALLNETSDIEGRYAKGNIVYTLGELGAKEYVGEIIGWLESEQAPYVIEDGVQALGQLQNDEAIPIAVECLSNPDPVVRMMAVGALSKIKLASESGVDIAGLIQPLLDDRFYIVREQTNESLQKLEGASISL